MYTMLNHPYSLRIPIRTAYFLELLLGGTASRQDVFTNKIILTYLSMDLTAIFRAKLPFSSFLTPIHHTLSSSRTHTSDLMLKMVGKLIVSPH